MDPVKKSLWSLHLAVILLGATALFSRIIPLSALDITLGRAVIAFVVLALLVKLTGGNFRLHRRRDVFVALLLGLLMAVHWVTYFAAMQYSSVSVGMIALFTFPVITVLLEPFFEKIRLVWQDVASALVVLAGIALIVPEPSLGNDVTLGILVGVFSALLYALRNLIHRKYFSHYGGAQAMTYQTLVIVLCLAAFGSPALLEANTHTLGLLLVLGTICTAAPHALVAYTLIHLRAKTFSLVACMQPLYGVLLAVLVLGEQPTWQTLVGGLLVICAAMYETVNAHKLHPKADQ
ncbi:DMT family transporter [Aliiglaciecola sp. CAU 1673]|uniref:DMT family transporter n=1 Tax=Aliiglaciecola sp. CAU 1673 TaxID=3032595 RepID=UPI0023DBCDE0|nr:DMT family transporter [Aliiglaciecola sp. CAU 1673]MDF2178709.1 DMT family transporter [Aliiglaciecola sp. CAU 1673]